jgi:hypothetical protein
LAGGGWLPAKRAVDEQKVAALRKLLEKQLRDWLDERAGRE